MRLGYEKLPTYSTAVFGALFVFLETQAPKQNINID
jgi:hypothetical protein